MSSELSGRLFLVFNMFFSHVLIPSFFCDNLLSVSWDVSFGCSSVRLLTSVSIGGKLDFEELLLFWASPWCVFLFKALVGMKKTYNQKCIELCDLTCNCNILGESLLSLQHIDSILLLIVKVTVNHYLVLLFKSWQRCVSRFPWNLHGVRLFALSRLNKLGIEAWFSPVLAYFVRKKQKK